MFSRLAQFPALSISAARFCPHPCGRTCGAGGPQQVAAAPAPPRPAAATSRASASASARHTEGNGTGRGASPQADRERPPQIYTGTLPPTTPRAHLSRGVGAAGAPGARFPQGATLGLRQEALAVQRGFDKARIAVELHQVEDLRRRRRAVSCRERSASRRERSASRQGSRPGPGAWVHPQLWRRAPSPSLPHAPPPSPSFTVDSRLLSDPRPAPTFNRVPASRFALFPTPPPPSLPLRLRPWIWPRLCSAQLPSEATPFIPGPAPWDSSPEAAGPGTCPVAVLPALPRRARPACRCSRGSAPGWTGTPGRCYGPPELTGGGTDRRLGAWLRAWSHLSQPQLPLHPTCWVSLAGICWKRSQAFQKVTFSALNSFFRNSWGWGEGGGRWRPRDLVRGCGQRDWDRKRAQRLNQTDRWDQIQRHIEGKKRQREGNFPVRRRAMSAKEMLDEEADRGVQIWPA